MAHGSSSDIDGPRGVVARRRPVVAAGVRGWYSTGRVVLGYPGVSGRSLTVCLRYPGRPSVAPVVRLATPRWSALPRTSPGRSTLSFVRSETPLSHASLGESLVTHGLFFVGDGPATINPTCATWLTNDPFGGGSLPDSRSYFDRQTTSGDLTWEFPIGPGRLRLDRHGDTTKAWPSP